MIEPPLTRSQWVVQRLRKAIITGEIKPGQPLITTALAEQWAISQTPLREALRILASEGLVDMSPQKTARVAQVSYRSFAELFEIRLLLEPLALERSLQRRNKEWEDGMQQHLQNLRDAIKGEETDPFEFESAHHSFHLALLSGCGSEQLLKLIDSLYKQSVRMRLLSASQRGGLNYAVIEEHEDLLELCRSSDIQQALSSYQTHIMTTLDLVLRDAGAAERDISDLTLIRSHLSSAAGEEVATG